MSALCLTDISFAYRKDSPIITHASLTLNEGEAAIIKGRSGVGKTTLAMIACGVIPKSVKGFFSGSVFVLGDDIGDKPIAHTAAQISMVSHEPESQLFAPAVIDEVAFAPENLCLDRDMINERVWHALERLGLEAFADHMPQALSRGQQQLVAFASVLALRPRILILDDIAAGIDTQGRKRLFETVLALKNTGTSLLIIEHEDLFAPLCDFVYVLENGSLIKTGGAA